MLDRYENVDDCEREYECLALTLTAEMLDFMDQSFIMILQVVSAGFWSVVHIIFFRRVNLKAKLLNRYIERSDSRM